MNPVIALVPPLAVLPLILLLGEKRRDTRELVILVAGVLLFITNVAIYRDLMAGNVPSSPAVPLVGSFALKLSAEPIGVLFGLLASFLWIVTTVYSIGYMRGHHEKHQTRFYACFAISLAAVMAAAYADNLLTLFVAYETLTLCTLPLVMHAGTDKARRAGKTYLGILLFTSIGLLLPAVTWVALASGTLDFRPGGVLQDAGLSNAALAILVALFVFGTAKAAVMPLHRWLPAAMVAPTPVSALLHAVAVVKTGVFALLKVMTYTIGIDVLGASNAAAWTLPVVAFTIIASSCVAFTKDNLKARLAYSTISQLSYIVMAALLATTMSITGGAMHIITHAFAKITLFFCAGAVLVTAHKENISDMDGLGRRMPVTFACFAIAALGIIGLPPVAGAWSKLLIAGGSFDTGTLIWSLVLMLSTLLNIAYLLPIPIRAFFRAEPAGNAAVEHGETSASMRWALTLTATASVLLFFFPAPMVELLERVQWR